MRDGGNRPSRAVPLNNFILQSLVRMAHVLRATREELCGLNVRIAADGGVQWL